MRPAMTETTPDYAGLSRRLGALAYHIQQTGTADGQDAQTCLEVAEALRALLESNAELERELEMWREVKHSSHWKARAEAAEAKLAEREDALRAALSAAARVRAEASNECGEAAHPAPQPSGAVEALTAIDEIITSSIQENGQPHRLKIGDEWHTGPAVDALCSILMGLRMVARSALTAGKPEHAVPSGWQTIATAPKDGTPVLLARFDRPGFTDDDLGPDGATVGHWAHFPSGNGGWYLSGLGVVGDYGGDYHPGNGAFSNNGWPELDPTHWMPLPPNPRPHGRRR